MEIVTRVTPPVSGSIGNMHTSHTTLMTPHPLRVRGAPTLSGDRRPPTRSGDVCILDVFTLRWIDVFTLRWIEHV